MMAFTELQSDFDDVDILCYTMVTILKLFLNSIKFKIYSIINWIKLHPKSCQKE